MTVKKRLFVSNILMILVPVCITLLIAAGCLAMISFAGAHGGGLDFNDSEDFYRASKAISELVQQSLKAAPEEQKKKLDFLSNLLDQGEMSLVIKYDGSIYYSYGDASKN